MEVLMKAVVAAIVVGLMAAGAVKVGKAVRNDVSNQQKVECVREALVLPGTGLVMMSDQELAVICGKVEKELKRVRGEAADAGQVFAVLADLSGSEKAYSLRVFPGRRSLHDICRQMGRLLVQRRRLVDGGRKGEVADCLRGLSSARRSGMTDDEVQALAREAIGHGDLTLSPAEQCRAIDEEVKELVHALVVGSQAASEYSSL
jgi:hypothetical protein